MAKLRIVLAIGLMFGLIETAQSVETLFSAGFKTSEGYSTGPLVTGFRTDANPGQQGWYGEAYYSSYVYTNEAEVSTDRGHTGQHSLKIPKEDYYYDYYRHDFESKDSDTLTIQWYQWLDNFNESSVANTNNVFVSVGNMGNAPDTGGANARIPYAGGEYNNPYGPIIDAGENTYYYWDQDRPDTPWMASFTQAGVSADDQWVGIRVVMDLDAWTHDIWVDETDDGSWTQVVTNAALRSGADRGAMSSFSLYQLSGPNYFNNDTYAAYVDDISITWVPEPSSIGLLLVGSLAILRRRYCKV